MAIKVVVADDHSAVRIGLASLLQGTDIKIAGEASTGKQAVTMTRKHKPQVLLLDVRLPEGDGLTALAQVRKDCPKTNVVMLSTFDNPTYVARSVALGASDYLLKGCSRRELISVIQAAAKGTGPIKAGEMTEIAELMENREIIKPFTSRETQVLRHITLALSNKEIARALGISIETVKEHVQKILMKLKFTDRTQVAVWSLREGIID